MILEKIYSEPMGLFPEVTFKNGINFIFGKKDTEDSKKSLNGIGKSLLVDIIDYCLCANLSERLRAAKAKKEINLQGYSVILIFRVNSSKVYIKRSFDKTGEVTLVFNGQEQRYKISEAKEVLCDLIFHDAGYEGIYSSAWLRKLIPFFIKTQPPKRDNFSDPISYQRDSKIMELMQFHLFLLGIDNTLSCRNYELKSNLKLKNSAVREVKKFIEETYGLKNISDASNELDKTTRETKVLEGKIKEFKLAEQYKDAESSSNELTDQIKKLIYANYSDSTKLKTYNDSYKIGVDFNVQQISKIYGGLSETLGVQVSKTLEEAIAFKKELAKSRQSFLREEVLALEEAIKRRNTEIEKLEEDRSKIFIFLEAKEAIRDLSEAYLQLSRKQEAINDLSGKIGLHTALIKEQAELKTEDAKLYSEIVNFIDGIQARESEIRAIFAEIYNSIYIEFKDQSSFSISGNDRKDQKIEINIHFPSDLSKGKNQGRTLVYDLAVVIQAMKEQRNIPRFLIHDGIFDGIDKAHFVHLYKYLQRITKNLDFQYIVTLNEEGVLNDATFGEGAHELTSQRIEQESIIVLTPDNKLFKKDF